MYSHKCEPDAYVLTNFTNGVTISMLQHLEIDCIKTQTWWFKRFRKFKKIQSQECLWKGKKTQDIHGCGKRPVLAFLYRCLFYYDPAWQLSLEAL